MEEMVRGMLLRPRFDLTLGCGRFAFDPSNPSSDLLRAVGDNDPGLYRRIESYVRPVRESHRHLAASGVWPEGSPKPPRPKEALEAVLRRNRIPRSSALYSRVAAQIGVKGCVDPAFEELRAALRSWFPPADSSRQQGE